MDQPAIHTDGKGDILMFRLISRLQKAILLVLLLIELCDSSTAWGQSVATRSYTISGHGRLELAVPKQWRDSVLQPPEELPPTITFSPTKGNDFKFLVTPIWSVTSAAGFNSPQKIRELLENRGGKLLASAVEKELVFHELKGPKTAGYYFSFTDKSSKSPDPDDYKYMTQGAIGLGDLMVMFTFLSNNKESHERNTALETIKNAVQKLK